MLYNDDGIATEEFKALPEEPEPPEELQGKPFPTEHAARIQRPNLYKRFRRENDKFGSGVHAIWGVRKDNDNVEGQALRFAVGRFTVTQARTWFRGHDYTVILFEPATGKTDEDVQAAGAPDPANASPAKDDKRGEGGKAVDEITRTAPVPFSRFLSDAKIELGKADEQTSPNGYIEGYASAFNVKDLQGEIVIKGAFLKTIAERGAAGKIPLMAVHFGSGGDIREVAGAITRLEEDEYGLKFRAEFLDTTLAQDVRKTVAQLIEKGVTVGTSIGYRKDKYEFEDRDGERVLIHKSINLKEITITLMPANEGAFVTNGKSEFVAAVCAVAESKTEALPSEKSRLLDEIGGAEKAVNLADELQEFAGKLRDLAAGKPQDTEAVAGGADKKTVAPTPTDVDLHLERAAVDSQRRQLVLMGLA